MDLTSGQHLESLKCDHKNFAKYFSLFFLHLVYTCKIVVMGKCKLNIQEMMKKAKNNRFFDWFLTVLMLCNLAVKIKTMTNFFQNTDCDSDVFDFPNLNRVHDTWKLKNQLNIFVQPALQLSPTNYWLSQAEHVLSFE